jgi:alpha-D-xyloside xylohydrolase
MSPNSVAETNIIMKILTQANLFLVILLVTWTGCEEKAGFERWEHGITVYPDDNHLAKAIRLTVITDEIVRVTATPRDSFPKDLSLMIAPGLEPTGNWKIHESENDIAILTSALRVNVSRKTGAVTFTDTTGMVVLQEASGGKTFEATQLEGQEVYKIRQVFNSPQDEAFYGLGGHQNGQMNYKNQDVELVQHNIVDVVPFLYSSKNYGILWDNYSISKFGDPRDYQSLSTLKLFSEDGKPGGLTAKYYVRDKVVRTAQEDRIEYEYLETPQVDNFPKDVAANGKVVWEGSFTSDIAGAHKFQVYASGYFKVWIDNALILDKWRQNWNPWTNKFAVSIQPGEKHTIKIEWNPDYGGYMGVRHLDPLPAGEQSKLSLSSEVADAIDYYFIKGENADSVIKGYRHLTGKAPIVPIWAMGYWQSRERYRNQEELVNTVKEYRKRRIPLDNIVLDWQYWEDPKWGSHEFDASRFPDPQRMVDELHDDLHARLMISVWPKFNKGTDNYEAMNKKGFLFTRNADKKRKDWVGPGYVSTFYDPFNPEAGAMFWNQIDSRLNRLGIDAWWLDATEPDMHSNLSIEERKNNMSPTALGPGTKYFNAYSLQNSRSVYEGQRRSSPDKRVFILTRSAYAGQQRYGAATWSGDIVSRWSDFQDQIATGINFSLSGIPYWTMDIGGFAVERKYENAKGETLNEWQELNTRWFQFGAFCPLFRSHGQYPYREIFNISEENSKTYESMVYYTKLRYRLLPYLYSLAGSTYWNDGTMMRGLVMDFNHDSRVHGIADQYMLGPSLLVNPVYTYKATSRNVYLPAGTGWYDFYTGEYFKGGQHMDVEAPLERIPLFVKAGSILPVGPDIQYTGEKKSDPVTLYVFSGANATFTLYEDEGVNYNYENGAYSQIPMTYDEEMHTLTIENREGRFNDMLEGRTFQIVWVKTDHPAGSSYMTQTPQVISYSGKEITINLK